MQSYGQLGRLTLVDASMKRHLVMAPISDAPMRANEDVVIDLSTLEDVHDVHVAQIDKLRELRTKLSCSGPATKAS